MPQPIHDQADDWLAAALLDDLSPEERRAFDEHIAACEHCRTLQQETLAMNEILHRDFAPAAGPSAGFETRLVSGFRQRQGRRGRARLLSLMGWLMRLRGVQAAGVAALLLALVEVGNVVTMDGGVTRGLNTQMHGKLAAPSPLPASLADVAKKVEIESKFVEITQSKIKELNFDINPGQSSVTAKSGSKAIVPVTHEFNDPTQFQPPQIPQNFGDQDGKSNNFPVTPTTPTSFGNGTLSFGPRFSSVDAIASDGSANRGGTLTLNGSNTYTGATAVNAGKLSVSNADHYLDDADRPGNRADKVKDAAKFEGFINYGSPIQTVTPTPATPTPLLAAASTAALAPAQQPQLSIGEIVLDPTPAPIPAAPDARKLIRNARAELEVASFDAATDAIAAAATQDGGYIDTKNSARGANGKLNGTLVVKVLPDNLERFLQRLRPLGEVKNQTVQTEDVTKAYFDTDARLRNAKRMEDRLLKMLDEVKGKMSEVLQVEKELGRVRADIEQMQGELKVYDAQVRYATVSLNVYEKDLNQPAAFSLRETANLALLAYDVEKTFAETRRIADAARAQVLESNLSRDGAGRSKGRLRLLVAPDASAGVIAAVKALGRVENFTLQNERIAQNGAAGRDAAGADSAKVERAPVTFVININHDEQTRRQVSLTLVAKDMESAFDKARAAAANAEGEVVNSFVSRPQGAHSSAVLAVRVPARNYSNLLEAFKALGRTTDLQTLHSAESDGAGQIDDGPTLITLNLADAESPVQQTSVRVLTPEVEKRLAEIKQAAAATPGVEAQNSTFSRESDGSEQAALSFRLPLNVYPAFIDRVRALGEVKDFTVQRQDRPVNAEVARGGINDASAPVEVSLRLYSEGRIVGESSGLGATLRRTFAQGTGALMWSVQMIGVALAFLAPWAGALALGVWLGRRLWLRRRAIRLTTERKPE